MRLETYTPEPRFADTLPALPDLRGYDELYMPAPELWDILTTEEQDTQDAEQLAAVREWLKREGN